MALIRDIAIGLSVQTGRFSKGLKDAGSQLNSFTAGFAGGLAAIGGGAILEKATSGIWGMVTAGADLNATLSKTGIIFGDSSGTITKEADELAAKYGTVKTEFVDAAASFGAVFKGLGKGQDEAAKMGVSLAKLGMDLASFEGGTATNADAFGAISGALRGEFDTMERFRVFLSADKIEAEALASGLAKTKGEITDYAKKTATLNLILKQTTDAQGDMARTSGEADNQIKGVSGRLTNLASTIGTAFTPLTEAVASFANSTLAGLTSAIAASRGTIDAFVTSLGGLFSAVLEVGGSAFTALTGIVDGFKPTLTSWVDWVLGGIDTVAMVLRNLPTFWEIAGIKTAEALTNMGAHLTAFATNLGIIGDYISKNWLNLIVDAFNALGHVILNFADNLNNLIESAFSSLISGKAFEFNFRPLLDGFKATAAELPKLVDPELVSFQDQVDAKLAQIGQAEAARAKEVVAEATAEVPAAVAAADVAKPGTKDKGPSFAAALEAGSAAAYTAQLKFQGQDSKDEPMKEVAKEAPKQTALLTKIADKITKPASGSPAPLFNF